MPNFHVPLIPNKIYHLLSRANGNEKIFRDGENYRFFLSRMEKYINPIADLYSYCLLPNHFHLMAQIKSKEVIEDHFLQMKPGRILNPNKTSDFIMERFSNFLNSYTKSFNKMYNRKGGLFMDFLRRVQIEGEEQFRKSIFYIHKNPVHHGYCKNIGDWKWSSYNQILHQSKGFVNFDPVLKYFGDIQSFKDYHAQQILLK